MPDPLRVGGSQLDLPPVTQQVKFPEAERASLVGNMIPMGLSICELHQLAIGPVKPDLQLIIFQ